MKSKRRLWFVRPRALGELKAGEHGVIEASAGTGKTYTIEHLVVDLLRRSAQEEGLTTNLRLEEILVVTYTNAATADLKKKIRQRISDLVEAWQKMEAELDDLGVPTHVDPGSAYLYHHGHLQCIDANHCGPQGPLEEVEGQWVFLCDESIALLRRGLRNFDQAAIYTIHGFCQRVLTEHAFASGRLLEQEHRSEEEVFQEAMGAFLREEAAMDEGLREWLKVYLNQGKKIADLQVMLREYGQKRRQIEPSFNEEYFLKLVDTTIERSTEALTAWQKDLKDAGIPGTSIKTSLSHFQRIKQRLQKIRPKGTPDILMELADLDRSRKYFLDGTGKGREVLAVKSPVSQLLGELFRKSASFEAAMGAVFGQRIETRVEALKEREGYFTYQDMLELVAESLKEERQGVLTSLRERFCFGVIDEFQDTDELQWEIFRRIFVESPRKDCHLLFVVGDPKQSIYGFRGGDIFTYIEARDELIGAAKPVFLTHNYRSTKELIQGYNKIFTDSFSLGEGIGYEHPVAPGKEKLAFRRGGPQGESVPALEIYELEGQTKRVEDLRRGMARAFARRIKELLDDEDGYWLGEEGAPAESWVPVDASHIFVLCRKVRQSLQMGEELRKLGVPFAFFKMDGLFQTREAEEIYELLRALENPGDRGARARAWMTAFFDLGLRDLEQIREIGEEGAIYQRLLQWSTLAHRRRYRELFSALIAESGVVRRQLLLSKSEREITNYFHILELLAEEAESRHLEIGELATRLKGYIDDRIRPEGIDGDQQRLEVEEQAVNILTVHASKGLQRGVVFYLPDFSEIREKGELRVAYEQKGKRRRISWMAGLSAMPNVVKRAYLSQARSEEHRLDYVAMTRPEALLVIPCIADRHPKYSPRGPGNLKRMPYLDVCDRLYELKRDAGFDDVSVWKPINVDEEEEIRPAKERVRRGLVGFSTTLEKTLQEVQDIEGRSQEEEETRERMRARRWEITSYSKLKGASSELGESVELSRAGFDDPLATAVGVTVDELPGGMNTGNFLHKVLEDLDYGLIGEYPTLESFQAQEDLQDFFLRRARQYGLGLDVVPKAMEVIYDTLRTSIPLPESPLTPIPGLYKLENTLKEMEFLFPIPEVALRAGKAAMKRQFAGLDELQSGFVTGVVDLVFSHQDKIYFGDWKSDACRDYQLATLRAKVEDRYANQANLYTLALARVLGIENQKDYERRFGGLYYFFLRGMKPGSPDGVYYERIDWEDLMAYEGWLSENYLGTGGRR